MRPRLRSGPSPKVVERGNASASPYKVRPEIASFPQSFLLIHLVATRIRITICLSVSTPPFRPPFRPKICLYSLLLILLDPTTAASQQLPPMSLEDIKPDVAALDREGGFLHAFLARARNGLYEKMATRIRGMGQTFLGNLVYKTDFDKFPQRWGNNHGFKSIHNGRGADQDMQVSIFGEIAHSNHGTALGAGGDHKFVRKDGQVRFLCSSSCTFLTAMLFSSSLSTTILASRTGSPSAPLLSPPPFSTPSFRIKLQLLERFASLTRRRRI